MGGARCLANSQEPFCVSRPRRRREDEVSAEEAASDGPASTPGPLPLPMPWFLYGDASSSGDYDCPWLAISMSHPLVKVTG